VSFVEGWRLLLGMIRDETLSFAGYIGMKIVLAIGASVVFGILAAIAVVFLILPVGLVAAVVVIMAKGGTLSWNAVTVTAGIVALMVVFAVLMYVVALVCVPVAVFFPAYAMYFFAERFPALHARLYPLVPTPPWTPVPVG
jgi:hypothetical protein